MTVDVLLPPLVSRRCVQFLHSTMSPFDCFITLSHSFIHTHTHKQVDSVGLTARSLGAARLAFTVRPRPVKGLIVGHTGATSVKDPIMMIKVPDKVEMFLEQRVLEHQKGIATDWLDLVGFKKVMLVQEPAGRVSRQRALVEDSLSVVLTVRFEFSGLHLPEPIGGTVKLECLVALFINAALDIGRVDGDGAVFYETRIGEPDLASEVLKVVPVQCTRQTLTPQQRVVPERLWDPATGVDIRKV